MQGEDHVDTLIDQIVETNQIADDATTSGTFANVDQLGNLPIWIGSRRSGRPPDCWEHFDCVLNVTDQEYEHELPARKPPHNQNKYYLQLPVAEGKRDKSELERWLPVGWMFLWQHICRSPERRNVLIHCNQGKDRSVAMALAFTTIACQNTFPLRLDPSVLTWQPEDLMAQLCSTEQTTPRYYRQSGLGHDLVSFLLSDEGPGSLLAWIHQQTSTSTSAPLASKESLRIGMHLIRQYREVADPSRATMQKLNRFFMSHSLYRR